MARLSFRCGHEGGSGRWSEEIALLHRILAKARAQGSPSSYRVESLQHTSDVGALCWRAVLRGLSHCRCWCSDQSPHEVPRKPDLFERVVRFFFLTVVLLCLFYLLWLMFSAVFIKKRFLGYMFYRKGMMQGSFQEKTQSAKKTQC